MNAGLLVAGLLAIYSALCIAAWLIGAAPVARVTAERRRGPGPDAPSTRNNIADSMAQSVERALRRRGLMTRFTDAISAAGLKTTPGQYAVLVGGAALGGGAAGLLLGGVAIGLLLALVVVVVGWKALSFLAARRRAAFADQLDDALQLIASSLRAGHSLLRALDSVADEAESPAREEFARVVNETKVGRNLGRTLEEAAQRNRSDDFHWAAQAIAIHRDVGGNLADVLDGVSNTIRERNQIRRQVKALSAEGKLSAYVLMALPIGILAFLSVTNPTYIGKFFASVIGMGMLVVAALLMAVGAFWLSRVVKIKF